MTARNYDCGNANQLQRKICFTFTEVLHWLAIFGSLGWIELKHSVRPADLK